MGTTVKVFLPWAGASMENQREELYHTLSKAGMDVFPQSFSSANEEILKEEISAGLSKADCSAHLIGNEYGETLSLDASVSFIKYQYQLAKQKTASGNGFKMFIWHPQYLLNEEKEILQDAFINEIRYGIVQNMIFSNTASAIQLANDIRMLMSKEEVSHFDVKDTEIFIMFNQLDEPEANDVIDMLGDIVDVEKLNIIQDSDTDYSELCNQQIGKSKLAVIYFRETSDWALPFVQQVWKKVGGASSHTPILLIGTDDPVNNKNKIFKAPKVISLILSGELVPLEIKVQYDKVLEILQK
jgi:hypothetical protein